MVNHNMYMNNVDTIEVEIRTATCVGIIFDCWKNNFDPTEDECKICQYFKICDLLSRFYALISSDDSMIRYMIIASKLK